MLFGQEHVDRYRATGGEEGHDWQGTQALILTTKGRKSGEPRTVMLTSPLQEGDTYVVVASRGGDDKAPAWLYNVEACADVTVSVSGGPAQPWKARVATADERARMWPVLSTAHKNYAGYQKKTTREIPLVLLSPA